MTPSEKRFYKLNFGQSEGKFSELYEVINRMEIYDEAVVKKRLGKASKNLKVHKIQLTELLLKSLTLFHRKKSVYSKIRSGLEEADLLIERELYDMAADRLEKLKKLCVRYEEYAYLLEITDREFRLGHIRFDKSGDATMPIYERLRNYIAILDEQYKYAELGNEMLGYKRKFELTAYPPEVVQYCRHLLAEDFLQPALQPRSFYGKIHRNTLMVFLHDIVGNEKESLQFRREGAALFRANPQLATHHSFDYLNTLRNLVNIYTREQNYAEAESIIREARHFATKNNIQREQLVYFIYAELVIAYERRRFAQIESDIETRLVEQLQHYDIVQDRVGLVSFLYLAISNLLLEKHAKTQQYLRALHTASKDLRNHFTEIYETVALISHYESGEHTLVKNLATARKRKLANVEGVSSFYRELLGLFRHIADRPFEAAAAARDLLARLPGFKPEPTLGMFRYFHLDAWLLALSNRHAFSEEMRSQNK